MPFPGLNPCFSGTYSQRTAKLIIQYDFYVLILVLVEHTLREPEVEAKYLFFGVLILVLVEHTLRDFEASIFDEHMRVLILVLVEHTLRATQELHPSITLKSVLILVLVEHTLRGL